MPKTILVADDEPGFRDLFPYLLEPMGFEVTCVKDGVEAVETIQQKSFDLILMDIHMPRMGGLEALKKIKAIRPGQKVIICSSSSDPSYAREKEALESGAFGCLLKPVEMTEFEQALKKALNEKGRSL